MAERRITYDNELEIMIEDYLANPLEAELERIVEGLEEEELAERRTKVQGCFGAPMTDYNKKRYTNNNSYNAAPARKKLIEAADADTFGFDCKNIF